MNTESNGRPSSRWKFKQKDRDEPSTDTPMSDLLSAEFDQLNMFWKAAESKLAAMHTPVCCEVVYKSHEGYQTHDVFLHSIAWIKSGKDWRICHATYWSNDPEGGSWRPIVECPADERVEAAPAFEELKAKVTAASQAYLEKVRQANAKLAELLK